MTPSYCLRLVSQAPRERIDDVVEAVAAAVDVDPDALKDALAQPAGAIVIKSGSLEFVTEVKVALRREGVMTEAESIPSVEGAVGRPQPPKRAPRTAERQPVDATEEATRIYRPPTPRSPVAQQQLEAAPSAIPTWLKSALRWYWRLRPHQQFVVIGTSLIFLGMMLPVGIVFGVSRTYGDLSPARYWLTLALVGITVWATLGNRRMLARYTSSIASVLVLFAMANFRMMRYDFYVGMRDIGLFADLFSDAIRSVWSGQLFLIVGIVFLLVGVFRKWLPTT